MSLNIPLLSVIKEFIAAKSWQNSVSIESESYVGVQFKDFTLLLKPNLENTSVMLIAVDDFIPASKRIKVADFIMHVSEQNLFGGFRLRLSDGLLTHQTYVDILECNRTEVLEMLDYYTVFVFCDWQKFYPGIKAILQDDSADVASVANNCIKTELK